MSESDVSKLISELQSFPAPKDELQRQRLYDAANAFALNFETERTTQHRIMFTALSGIVPRIASDLKIFEILFKSPEPLSTAQLAERTKADPALIRRILRFLSSIHTIREVSSNLWTSSPQTAGFANPAYAAGLRFSTALILPAVSATPEFLAKTNYQNPFSATNCPFQPGHKTDLAAFEWLEGYPEIAADFNIFMAESHKGMPSAFDVLPFDKLVGKTDPETVTFVDVGGGIGKSSAELKEKFPGVKGRIINQDQEKAISAGVKVEGVEHQIADFFAEQPVKGARAYYLRRILHDWPDDKSVEILGRIAEAMGEESVLLIDEIVMPDQGAHWFAAFADIAMMMGFGAGERTRGDYEAILDKAGMKVRGEWRYVEDSGETVLVAVKK